MLLHAKSKNYKGANFSPTTNVNYNPERMAWAVGQGLACTGPPQTPDSSLRETMVQGYFKWR